MFYRLSDDSGDFRNVVDVVIIKKNFIDEEIKFVDLCFCEFLGCFEPN